MKKLLFLLIIGLYSCTGSNATYTITVPFEGSTYYYYVESYKIDSAIKCVTFPLDEGHENKILHTLCGTYQITKNH